jgi:AraC-like DNA-binding protein
MIVQDRCTILHDVATGAEETKGIGLMDVLDYEGSAREADRAHADRDELVERLARAIRADGTVDPLPGLRLRRASAPTELGPGVARPSFCVIAQGAKEILLGDRRYRYDPAHYLIASIELPIASRIVEASPEHPYLSVIVALDAELVGSVLVEAGRHVPRGNADVRAIDVSPLDAGLLDAVVRLVRLLDAPTDARYLAPLVTREIVYRLLLGEQGGRLSHIAAQGDSSHRIAEAVERLRRDFDRPLRVEDVARELGMSISGFHHHFKAVTGLSPLQFQKQLRLQEARRLLLGEHLDAASAGYRVGYDDASHFNREYKRLFGAPPLRDAQRQREAAWAGTGL